MTIPSLIFGFVLATLYGAAFHLWRNGGPGRLLLYILLSMGGFTAGHLSASHFNITIDMIGPLHIGFATLGSVLLLFFGYWLSLVEVNRNPESQKRG